MMQRSPLTILILIIVFLGANSAMATEEASYEIVKVEDSLDVHRFFGLRSIQHNIQDSFHFSNLTSFEVKRYLTGWIRFTLYNLLLCSFVR